MYTISAGGDGNVNAVVNYQGCAEAVTSWFQHRGKFVKLARFKVLLAQLNGESMRPGEFGPRCQRRLQRGAQSTALGRQVSVGD